MNGAENVFSLDRYDVLRVEAIERTEDLRVVTDAGRRVGCVARCLHSVARKRIGVIVSEMMWVNINDGQIEAHALLGFLRTQGYAVYDFCNFGYAESGQFLWGNAVFTADASRVPRI